VIKERAMPTQPVRRRFELTDGIYIMNGSSPEDTQVNPERQVVFRKGAIIESEEELDKKWVNKFRRVSGEETNPVTPDRIKYVDQMIEDGLWDEEDRSVLEHMNDYAFMSVQKQHQRAMKAKGQRTLADTASGEGKKEKQRGETKPQAEEEEDEQQEEKPQDTPKKGDSLLGDDVTDKFPKAKQAGLMVFKNPAGKHQVADAKEPNKPVTPQPIEAAKVNKFVEDYSKEK
jgi:hypothetical protein